MTAEGENSADGDWALIAYLCGDNPHLEGHVRAQMQSILDAAMSARLGVAAQWDLPDRTERAASSASNGWEREQLGRVNTGDPEAFITFLRWAFDRFPTERVIVVVSGTGLLDQRAALGGPETDRAHLFTVCHDSTAGDALSLSEIGRVVRTALQLSMRNKIDILAFDMRELQCLEVAYEFEGIVDALIAPQTRIPDAGWNFADVLRQCDAGLEAAGEESLSVFQMARLLVRTVGAGYSTDHDGNLSLSALNLHALKPVASAFDTLSLAMVQSVGEELVWKAREAVARRLKPPTTASSSGQRSARPWEEHRQLEAEIEYLYDLPEMLIELRKELEEATHTGLVQLVRDYFKKLDAAGFEQALQSIDDACFASGARLRHQALARVIANPVETRQRLGRLMALVRDRCDTWADDGAMIQGELASLLTDATPAGSASACWIGGWPEEVVASLVPELGATYDSATRQLERLTILAALTDRVLALLRGGATDSNHMAIEPLVLEHFVSSPPDVPMRHGGVSLYRPRNLDQLIASDYLKLRFNRKIHWTVLLAVVNLIGNYPRGLWRILSAVLATADNNTRAQLIDRIAGPGSVIAPFRQQFVVLSPFKALVLSLDPDPSVMPAATPAEPPSDEAVAWPRVYRVRLETGERDAFISEVISIVDPEALKETIAGLERLLKLDTAVDAVAARAIESLGKSLGEDILQDLGVKLAENVDPAERAHLQLQIPRDLMQYPWELMQHKSGWLAEHFALGRQVFSRTGGGTVKWRVPGPLRALVIGNPTVDAPPLPYAEREAAIVATTLEALASETDGLIDFKIDRDAWIGRRLTRDVLRQMLRQGHYDILHFAGHAAFHPDHPETSAWLLSDGPFSAQLIRNTLRWRETQPWLVFANACEAAMDGQSPKIYQTDVFGLASAFLDNGVGVFIGPLWRIDDAVAGGIAQAFYYQLLKERQTVGESLRYAKTQAKRRHFDPFVVRPDDTESSRLALVSWAGLVLYGNSTTTIGQRMGAPPPSSPKLETEWEDR